MAKLEGPQKRKIQAWRLEEPTCAPSQPHRMEKHSLGSPFVGKPKPIEKEEDGKGILHINKNILKESSRVGRQSEPGLEAKTR